MTQSNEDRDANKQGYFAKRMYRALLDVGKVLSDGEAAGLSGEQMGSFGETAKGADGKAFNVFREEWKGWRDESKRLANIPDWQSDEAGHVRDLTYPNDSKPSAK